VRTVADDLGARVELPDRVQRVVSLVPSLTESVATTEPAALVAVTQWCTHPPDLDVERVRGTKNPDVRRIAALHPDVVLANQEENRRLDVERLRAAGVPVWVTAIESVPEALKSLRRMFVDALVWEEPEWLAQSRAQWLDELPSRLRVAIPVWRDPWMVVGSRTFAGDLAARLGLVNVFADDPARYPRVEPAEIARRRPDVVLLPDEPYAFSAHDGPDAFPGLACALVDGRALTWYGPSLLTARGRIESAIAAATG